MPIQSNTVQCVQAENVPPIISSSLRSATVFNTELQKKSVYLKGNFFERIKSMKG